MSEVRNFRNSNDSTSDLIANFREALTEKQCFNVETNVEGNLMEFHVYSTFEVESTDVRRVRDSEIYLNIELSGERDVSDVLAVDPEVIDGYIVGGKEVLEEDRAPLEYELETRIVTDKTHQDEYYIDRFEPDEEEPQEIQEYLDTIEIRML